MTRLKKRVQPEFPAQVQRKQVKVRAAVRIDDSGNTTVHALTGGSPVINRAVVKAVQDWKFYPAKVDSQPRCVETEFFIVLTR
jgi:outer membrane biosynthesis protein TonB